MQVSFVIPLFNCLPLTQACLASLQASLPPGLEYEVILIDDGSTDGTRAWLATLAAPARGLLNATNLGYGASNNRAAATARAPLLVFSNNDVVFSRGWFEPLVAVHRALGPRAGVVGNVQRDARTGEVDHAGITFDHRGKAGHVRSAPAWRWFSRHSRALVPAVTGACFAISRARWDELGGFDPGYVNGSEDVDLCLRARAAGALNAVALRSVVRHHVSASPGRKLRDEANSHRFTARWRSVVAHLALPAIARHHLERNWLGPRNPADFRSALAILLFRCGVRPPPAALAALADAALDRELDRWETLLQVPPCRCPAAPEPAPRDPTLV